MTLTSTSKATDGFALAEGTKYACVVTHVPFLHLNQPLRLDATISLFPGFHAQLPDHWTEWLGSTFGDRLQGYNLVILATAHSERPEVLDREHYELGDLAVLFFQAMLLLGAKSADVPTLLKGSQVQGELNVRQVGDLGFWRKHESYPYTVVDEAKLRQVHEIWRRLLSISGTGKWLRFIKGYRALAQAATERTTDERTHHWVRSLEALLKTDQGQATRQFRERCQLFTGMSPAFEDLLRDAYNTRSFVEHMNGLDSLSKNGESFEDTATRVDSQSCDMEIIALEAYRTILCSDALLKHFETDATTSAFWALPAATREAAWPSKIDPAAIRAAREAELENMP